MLQKNIIIIRQNFGKSVDMYTGCFVGGKLLCGLGVTIDTLIMQASVHASFSL